MGTLIYGDSGIRVIIDDFMLAHVQIVVGMKLRMQQSFFVAWKDGLSVGGGRSSLWITASAPLVFSYERAAGIRIDPAHIRRMMEEADSAQGLVLDGYLSADMEAPRSNVRSVPTRGQRITWTPQSA